MKKLIIIQVVAREREKTKKFIRANDIESVFVGDNACFFRTNKQNDLESTIRANFHNFKYSLKDRTSISDHSKQKFSIEQTPYPFINLLS